MKRGDSSAACLEFCFRKHTPPRLSESEKICEFDLKELNVLKSKNFFVSRFTGVIVLMMVLSISASAVAPPQTSNEIDQNRSVLQVGESIVWGQMGNETLSIKLVESSVAPTRGMARSTSQIYDLQSKTIFGIDKTLVRVTMTCNWYEDGKDSYISSLNGSYTKLDSAVTCLWEESHYTTSTYVNKSLSVYYNGNSAYVIFDALMNKEFVPVTVTLGIGSW